MSSEVAEAIGSQEWLDPTAKTLQSAVNGAFEGEAGRNVKDALNGVWLGHALHPVMTDIPIGAWMMAQVFDGLDAATGGRRYEDAARVCVTTGVLGAVGAAVTGLTDWSDTGGGSRRIGLVHALINITATSCFLTSALMRRRGRSTGAVSASATGFAIAMAGAYLGGALVYQRQIGVNHAMEADVPEQFTRVLAASELGEGEKRKIDLGDAAVLLVKSGGHVYAMEERCAHQGGPLVEGELRDGVISCPWHNSQFRVSDGQVIHGPSTFNQPCYETRIIDGFIEVRQRQA
jgi:nitrite reductase/ring-hydroxylating ferredoxin subunit/uncharacterized membrane protein